MARLGVHVDVAARMKTLFDLEDLEPVALVMAAEIGGADGIVLCMDEKMQVSARDVKLIKEIVKIHYHIQTPFSDTPFKTALEAHPDMITLIPGSKPGTSEGGGVDILGQGTTYQKAIADIRNQDIVCSVLIDPNVHQVKAAAKFGVDYVEFHLGAFAYAEDPNEKADQFENLRSIVLAASKLGLGVSAGRGVTYANASTLASLEGLEEMNAGNAIISRAMQIGMESAVRDMAALVH